LSQNGYFRATNHIALSSNDIIKYAIIGILTAVVAFLPESMLFGKGYLSCIHLRISGIECPLCGFTHAARAITRLQFADAIQYNFNAITLALLLVTDFAARIGSNRKIEKARNLLVWILASGLLAIYLYRISVYFG
jgi:hypothetical protein